MPGSSSSTRSDPIGPSVGDALEAAPPRRDAVALGDRLDHHEADVVAVAGVLRAGIAEPDEEQHVRMRNEGACGGE